MPKKILIINTGGTLSSVKSSKGLVNEDSRISVSRYVEGSGTALYMAQRRANWKALLQKEKTAFI